MTDINNNIGTNNINHVQNSGFDRIQPIEVNTKNYTDKEIKNLDNTHAALVGRSMVKKMPKTDKLPDLDAKIVENIKADLAELKANPELVKNAVALADLAIAKGIPYDKAIEMEREFADFHK